MMKLKLISFLLALLMMVQMVPVAQIGAMLSSNQWTEELPHNAAEDSSKSDTLAKSFLPTLHHNHFTDNFFTAASIYIQTSDQLPSNHATDVISPPPDVLS